MPAITRLGDSSTGHANSGPRASKQGSSTVFVNSIAVHRLGDLWVDHHTPPVDDEALSTGSSSVFANGLKVGRIGDAISCGDKVAAGSPTVFAG
jgi:uncharacterized Zn-binding protein involved in type VI secretion